MLFPGSLASRTIETSEGSQSRDTSSVLERLVGNVERGEWGRQQSGQGENEIIHSLFPS